MILKDSNCNVPIPFSYWETSTVFGIAAMNSNCNFLSLGETDSIIANWPASVLKSGLMAQSQSHGAQPLREQGLSRWKHRRKQLDLLICKYWFARIVVCNVAVYPLRWIDQGNKEAKLNRRARACMQGSLQTRTYDFFKVFWGLSCHVNIWIDEQDEYKNSLQHKFPSAIGDTLHSCSTELRSSW